MHDITLSSFFCSKKALYNLIQYTLIVRLYSAIEGLLLI